MPRLGSSIGTCRSCLKIMSRHCGGGGQMSKARQQEVNGGSHVRHVDRGVRGNRGQSTRRRRVRLRVRRRGRANRCFCWHRSIERRSALRDRGQRGHRRVHAGSHACGGHRSPAQVVQPCAKPVKRRAEGRPNALPAGHKTIVDEGNGGLIGEQHGSQGACIRSTELFVEPSKQLQQKNGLALSGGQAAGRFKRWLPGDLPAQRELGAIANIVLAPPN